MGADGPAATDVAPAPDLARSAGCFHGRCSVWSPALPRRPGDVRRRWFCAHGRVDHPVDEKKRGALYRKAKLPFVSYAVTDGKLVTGQNPGSAKETARKVAPFSESIEQ